MIGALYQQPETIAGLVFQPMLFGHAVLLARSNSALLEAAAEIRRGDLSLAMFICSRPPGIAAQIMAAPRKLKRSLNRIDCMARLCGWQRTAERFCQWVNDQLSFPRFWKSVAHKSDSGGHHWLNGIRDTHVVHLHVSTPELLDKPLKLAVWDHLTWYQSQGAVSIWSEKDYEIDAYLSRPRENANGTRN
jgi:hypothetical protein